MSFLRPKPSVNLDLTLCDKEGSSGSPIEVGEVGLCSAGQVLKCTLEGGKGTERGDALRVARPSALANARLTASTNR